MITPLLASLTNATGEPDVIYGYCHGGDDASITAWVPTRANEIVTDKVGATGQSGVPEMYLYDAGNLHTGWVSPCNIITMAAMNKPDGGYASSCSTSLITGSGAQQNPDITLTKMVVPTGVWMGGVQIDLTWPDPSDPNIIGYLVYRSDDNSTWVLIAGSTTTVSGYWWSNPCQIELADSWVAGNAYTDTTAPLEWNYYCLRYIYNGWVSGVQMGIPTQEHNTPGWDNPNGSFEPVYGPGKMAYYEEHYDAYAIGPIGTSSSLGPFNIQFQPNCGCYGEYDDVYYSNDNNASWHYVGSDYMWGDGLMPFTAPCSGTYWWIANADNWMGPGWPGNIPTPGTPAEAGPYTITLPSYDIPVVTGWNLISFPVDTGGSPAIILNDAGGDTSWSVLKWYNPQSPADPWKTYRIGSFTNDLNYIDVTMGLWIYITNPGSDGMLRVEGAGLGTSQQQLIAGWNLVGYPTLTPETVANVFWGTGVDKVEVFDPAEPGFIKEVGPTYIMQPGEGYWVYTSSDSIWTVDW